MYISFSSHIHLALIQLVPFSTDRQLPLNTPRYLYHRCLTHWTSSHTPTVQKICVQKAPADKSLKLSSLRIEHIPSCCIPVKCFDYMSFCPKVALSSSQELGSAAQTLVKFSGRKQLKIPNHHKTKFCKSVLGFSLWLRYPFQREASPAFRLKNDETWEYFADLDFASRRIHWKWAVFQWNVQGALRFWPAFQWDYVHLPGLLERQLILTQHDGYLIVPLWTKEDPMAIRVYSFM